jgi:hypothetical protein
MTCPGVPAPRSFHLPGVTLAGFSLRGLLLWLGLATVAAAMPEYVRQALGIFSPEVPPGWAYTLTTERDGRQIAERYDPSKPPAEQWSLQLSAGHPPTQDELDKYARYKASQAPGAVQATFQKSDIEPGSVELVHEDAERAELTCAFRAVSANADKMLGHLVLRLIVGKRQPHVERYTLELRKPYSPVLGVQMRELVVTMDFTQPGTDRPSLPERSSSHFAGRIFFVPVEENLRYSYSAFVRVP